MAETALKHGTEPARSAERYQVVVHVTAETLAAGDDGRCELEGGQRLAIDTVRRLACDASLVQITEDSAGNPLDIGRKTRAVSPALRRALRARDGGCRFPGCTQRRFVDAHHIRHWANGGETSIGNLLLLCRRHHRLVHEGRFEVKQAANGYIHFRRPDGCIIDEAPRLAPAAAATGLRFANRQTGMPVDASAWIIPSGPLDYGIAIGGLLRIGEMESRRNRKTT